MIQANELKIGIWVNYFDKPTFIHNKTELFMAFEHLKAGFISPIPLTPEILEKCGFVKAKDKFSTYWKLVILRTEVISIEDDGSFGLNAENESSSQGYAGGPIIKSLHQLQNLYFALTGEELNINL